MPKHDKVIVAISGASGIIYGVRLLEALRDLRISTFLVISHMAQRVLEHETDFTVAKVTELATTCYDQDDLFAPIASGSFVANVDAMAVVPCSMKTLSAIANGYSDNLIARAADVTIKEKKPLVLMPREAPFTAIHLRNMLTLAELGVTIFPPVPSFYDKPQTLEDMIQQTVARVIDHLGFPSDLAKRWGDFVGRSDSA